MRKISGNFRRRNPKRVKKIFSKSKKLGFDRKIKYFF
jgi:hypothetical protein